MHHVEPRLFDLLYDLTVSLNDAGGEIDVICGYRTRETNEFLRSRSTNSGVAVHSLHMLAEAIDIRLARIGGKGGTRKLTPEVRQGVQWHAKKAIPAICFAPSSTRRHT